MDNYQRAFRENVPLRPYPLWELLNQETETASRAVPARLDRSAEQTAESPPEQNLNHKALGKGLDPELWVWGKENQQGKTEKDSAWSHEVADLDEGPALAPPEYVWAPEGIRVERLRLSKRETRDPPEENDEVFRLHMDGLVFTQFEAAGVQAASLQRKIRGVLLIEIAAGPKGGSSVSGLYRSDMPLLADYLTQINEWLLQQVPEGLSEDVRQNQNPKPPVH